jgi:hypothetical protein
MRRPLTELGQGSLRLSAHGRQLNTDRSSFGDVVIRCCQQLGMVTRSRRQVGRQQPQVGKMTIFRVGQGEQLDEAAGTWEICAIADPVFQIAVDVGRYCAADGVNARWVTADDVNVCVEA